MHTTNNHKNFFDHLLQSDSSQNALLDAINSHFLFHHKKNIIQMSITLTKSNFTKKSFKETLYFMMAAGIFS